MRFIRKRALVALICILLSVILSWRILDIAERSKETIKVVRVTEPIGKGTLITGDKLRAEEVGTYGLRDDILYGDDSIIGMYASVDIFPGDNLTLDKFTKLEETADGFLILAQQAGKSAVSVSVKSISSVLAGKLRKGDVVSVLVFVNGTMPGSVSGGGSGNTSGNMSGNVIGRGFVTEFRELKYVEIGAISNNKAEDIVYQQEVWRENSQTSGAKQSVDGMIPASVTFVVNSIQARRLVEAENAGSIHLVFRGRGERAKQLLEEQDKVFAGVHDIYDVYDAFDGYSAYDAKEGYVAYNAYDAYGANGSYSAYDAYDANGSYSAYDAYDTNEGYDFEQINVNQYKSVQKIRKEESESRGWVRGLGAGNIVSKSGGQAPSTDAGSRENLSKGQAPVTNSVNEESGYEGRSPGVDAVNEESGSGGLEQGVGAENRESASNEQERGGGVGKGSETSDVTGRPYDTAKENDKVSVQNNASGFREDVGNRRVTDEDFNLK